MYSVKKDVYLAFWSKSQKYWKATIYYQTNIRAWKVKNNQIAVLRQSQDTQTLFHHSIHLVYAAPHRGNHWLGTHWFKNPFSSRWGLLQEEHRPWSCNNCKSDLNGKNPFIVCLSSLFYIWKNIDYYFVIFDFNLKVINQQGSCINPKGLAHTEDLDIELLDTTLVEIQIQYSQKQYLLYVFLFLERLYAARPRIVIFLLVNFGKRGTFSMLFWVNSLLNSLNTFSSFTSGE